MKGVVTLENLGRMRKRNQIGHIMLARVMFRDMRVVKDEDKI